MPNGYRWQVTVKSIRVFPLCVKSEVRNAWIKLGGGSCIALEGFVTDWSLVHLLEILESGTLP